MAVADDLRIEIVEERGETTLYIGEVQMMQAWEDELMFKSGDLLCEFGDTFLEVGLGLGLSGLHIARHPNTRSHTVVEKYQKVIDLFHQRHPELPESLHIVHADILDYAETLAPDSLDGIFFDPELPPEINDNWDAMGRLVLRLKEAIRPGGVFIPFFAVEPIIKEKYMRYFHRALIVKHPFATYANTNYTGDIHSGNAYIQAFIKE